VKSRAVVCEASSSSIVQYQTNLSNSSVREAVKLADVPHTADIRHIPAVSCSYHINIMRQMKRRLSDDRVKKNRTQFHVTQLSRAV